MALLLLLSPSLASAANGKVDVDDLPRTRISLPENRFLYNVRYLNRNWRETTADELARRNVTEPEDICFEAKVNSPEGETVRLLNHPGRIVCRDPEKLRFLRSLKPGDNVWFCGTLRSAPSRTEAILDVEDALKLPGDLARMAALVERLEKRQDSAGLLELGYRIGHLLATNVYSFEDHTQFDALRTRAWVSALNLREKALAPDDADGLFSVAEGWQELLRRTQKRNELIRRVLRLDPEHPQAGRVAADEMNLVKHEGRWLTLEERNKLLSEEEARRQRAEAQQREALAARSVAREEAVRLRVARLIQYQDALRMAPDAKALEGALRSLGEAVCNSLDPVFSRQGSDILAQVPGPAATAGLALAAGSEVPEVRREVYQALAWRGDAAALGALAQTLGNETDSQAVRGGVDALVRRRDKAAVGTLIAGLAGSSPKARAEIQEGLRQLTRQAIPDRDGWRRWWEANQNQPELILSP